MPYKDTRAVMYSMYPQMGKEKLMDRVNKDDPSKVQKMLNPT